MWHTHPDSYPIPSPTDFDGMRKLLTEVGTASSRPLLLIIGTPHDEVCFGVFAFSSDELQDSQGFIHRSCHIQTPSRAAPPPTQPSIGLALSGGGSRAIAFHLGCLRALHDLGILERVTVLSSVSGGSVIAAMWAYSTDTFADFDFRVVNLLRKGLAGAAVRKLLLPKYLMGCISTAIFAGLPALATTLLNRAVSVVSGIVHASKLSRPWWIVQVQPPFRRWVSRTDAFQGALRDRLFGARTVESSRRNNIEVILNACDLRTGTAFRYGSAQSGCWRYGRLAENTIPLAEAVAASAAYPAALPALDRNYEFIGKDGKRRKVRSIITDGGVFDNLGVTCLEPGRSKEFSTHAFQLDYILSCDAGAGQFSHHARPFWWPSRMVRSFESVFRKVQDGARDRLHRYRANGQIKGFILAYLGQADASLPYLPPDLVSRSAVAEYPTDFSPMAPSDIDLLAKRGEQLTRMLVEFYDPELCS